MTYSLLVILSPKFNYHSVTYFQLAFYSPLNHLWRAIIRDFPLGTILLTPEYYSPLQAAKSGYYCDKRVIQKIETCLARVQTLRAVLSAMEALPQALWSGKAPRFMANSSTPHLWAHVRQFFLKSLMFYIFFGWCRCDGAMSSHKTLVKMFAFGPKHCMMTGGNQPTMAGTREFRASSTTRQTTKLRRALLVQLEVPSLGESTTRMKDCWHVVHPKDES